MWRTADQSAKVVSVFDRTCVSVAVVSKVSNMCKVVDYDHSWLTLHSLTFDLDLINL